MSKYILTFPFYFVLLSSCAPSPTKQEENKNNYKNDKPSEKAQLALETKSPNNSYLLYQTIKFKVTLPKEVKKITSIQNLTLTEAKGKITMQELSGQDGNTLAEIHLIVTKVTNADGNCTLTAEVAWTDTQGEEHTDSVSCPFKIEINTEDEKDDNNHDNLKNLNKNISDGPDQRGQPSKEVSSKPDTNPNATVEYKNIKDLQIAINRTKTALLDNHIYTVITTVENLRKELDEITILIKTKFYDANVLYEIMENFSQVLSAENKAELDKLYGIGDQLDRILQEIKKSIDRLRFPTKKIEWDIYR